MRQWWIVSAALLGSVAGVVSAQGPITQGSETVARPKKKAADSSATTPTSDSSAPTAAAPAESSDLPKIPSKLSPKARQGQDEQADVTFTAESNVVTVDVSVLDNKGRFIPKIPAGNFRVLEDNVPQKISNVTMGEAPLTVALVVEFSNLFQAYGSRGWYETLQAAYGFTQMLKPDDYIAIIAYDMRSTILADFTNDKSKIQEAMSRLRVAGFSECNLYDALTDTADRMSKIEGRKAIVVITSGRDTFSKITYDKARKSLQESGVPVYSVEILQMARQMAEGSGRLGAAANMDFLQGDNALRTFAKETGGQAFFPVFSAQMNESFMAINQALRNQYTVTYSPSNQARDGKFRKITVQLVNPENNEPLRIVENNKPIKYTVTATNGYKAPLPVQ